MSCAELSKRAVSASVCPPVSGRSVAGVCFGDAHMNLVACVEEHGIAVVSMEYADIE